MRLAKRSNPRAWFPGCCASWLPRPALLTVQLPVVVLLLAPLLAVPARAEQPSPAAGAAVATAGRERFGTLARFAGTWQGTSELPDGSAPGLVELTCTYTLGGKFLRIEAITMFPPAVAGTDYDLERSVQWISFDETQQRFVARTFFGQGFVTRATVRLEDEGRTVGVESEAIANGAVGLRTRRTRGSEDRDRLVPRFEIEMPGAGWRTFHTDQLRRTAGAAGD